MATIEKVKNVKTHTKYKLKDGTIVPGVTTVLGVLAKPALIHWAWDLGSRGIDYRKYRDKMASIGTLAHYMIECDLKDEDPELDSYSKEEINLAENALISFWEWKKQYNPKPLGVELQLSSEKYRYGGTIDLYCEIDGELWLVDFKTGKAIYPEMVTQLSAYNQLMRENGFMVNKIRVLRIGRDETEGFEDQVKTQGELKPHWQKFRHCLGIYEANKKIKGGA